MEKISFFVFNNLWAIPIFLLWTLLWKGWALWKSARRAQLAWFVVLLIFNTLGILEMIYLFLYREQKEGQGGNYARAEVEALAKSGTSTNMKTNDVRKI